MQNATAPSTSRLLSSLKNSFSSSGSTNVAVATNTHSVGQSPILQTVSTVNPVTDDVKMQIFDNVLEEIQQKRVQNSTVQQPEIISTPTQVSATTVPQPVVMPDIADSTHEMNNLEPVVNQVEIAQPMGQAEVTVNQPLTDKSEEVQQSINDTAVLGQIAASIDPQQINSLNPPSPVGVTQKEAIGTATPTIEVGASSAGAVEFEASKEMSPEIESYIERVEDNDDQLPQEIVIADGSVTLSPVQYPAQPVVVIPITEQLEAEGKKKSPAFSLRWLVEWSQKMIKIFSGKVIYKQE